MWKLAFVVSLFANFHYGAFQEKRTVVTIVKSGRPRCAGVIVGNNFVVTAAQCVFSSEASEILVGLEFGQNATKKVKRILVHPYYMSPNIDYDVALLKTESLSGSFSQDEGRPSLIKKASSHAINTYLRITLVKKEPSPADNVTVQGWKSEGDTDAFKTEQVSMVERNTCKDRLNKYVTVTSKTICVNAPEAAILVEKVGSPLIFGNALAGIASRRVPGNRTDLPRLYANIANPEIFSFIDTYV